MAAIWRELLGVGAIDRHDSFFDLGGHSLLVARLLRRVEQDYGRAMTMAAFFRAHRLDEMARALADGAPADAGIASVIGSGLSGVRLMVLDEDAGSARALLGLPAE